MTTFVVGRLFIHAYSCPFPEILQAFGEPDSTRRLSLRWRRRSHLRNRKWFCDSLVGTFRMRCLLRVFSRGGRGLCQRGNLLSHIPFRRLEGRDVLGHLLLLARDLLRGTAYDGEIARNRLQLLLYCRRNVGQFRR